MKSSSKILLASASPRRQSLLKEAGINFDVLVKPIDEDYPVDLKREQVALFLAAKKAAAYDEEVQNGYTVITADTIVCVNNEILGKPADHSDAFEMLSKLSGKTHDVITAVCIRNLAGSDTFFVSTNVEFRLLSENEINHYISHYKPYDKAGAYGIQEWIGLVAITRINGSYNNVVGLPVAELYQHLVQLISLESE